MRWRRRRCWAPRRRTSPAWPTTRGRSGPGSCSWPSPGSGRTADASPPTPSAAAPPSWSRKAGIRCRAAWRRGCWCRPPGRRSRGWPRPITRTPRSGSPGPASPGPHGKPPTSLLVGALLAAGGRATGVIGTIEYRVGPHVESASQTTPEALELQDLLARMVRAKVGGVAMEVSSHALALHRVDGIEFDVAVFTNLTQDHLDFHGTLESYRDAKAGLFPGLPAGRTPRRAAVANVDDRGGAAMIQAVSADPGVRRITFGLSERADLHPRRWESGMGGIQMEVASARGVIEIVSPLVGEHNVMNLLGAIGVGLALDMEPSRIGEILSRVSTVPGRFERVEAGQPFLVVVDYAHTPDALENVLTTAR